MDKVFKPIVIVLLLAVLAVQAYALVPSPACQSAKADAKQIRSSAVNILINAQTNYDSDVYTLADNINQQILLSSENAFIVSVAHAQIDAAALQVAEACN